MTQHSKALAGWQPGMARRMVDASMSLFHGLFPPTCYLCLDPGQPPALELCRGCEEDLPCNLPACPACANPLPEAGRPCAECSARPRAFDAAFAPYRYEFPLPELVHRFKYRGQLFIGRLLGTLLARRLAERGRPRVDALVPVPLHPAREARRGYNQAREIAQFAGAALRLPVRADLARRVRDTEEQAALPAIVRATNVSGAFEVTTRVPPLSVAIVDDVLTTGATAEALARALKDAGCRHVEVWAAARAAGGQPAAR
ncbi:MAG TPA: ComF family protein [Steroidobacteraceae bacterium]